MAKLWFAKQSNMFGSNVVLHNMLAIEADGKLNPQPEPGSPDAARCALFPELFGQIEVDDSLVTASAASEQEAPVAPVADAVAAAPEPDPVPTPSVVSSTGLIESTTVTKRIKSKLGG